jgi:hypothetical protein
VPIFDDKNQHNVQRQVHPNTRRTLDMVHMRENLNAFSLHRDAEMIQGFGDAEIALLHDQSVISHLCCNMNGDDGHNQ